MKIAVAALGNNLESPVSPAFGQSPFIIIADVENEEIKNYEVIQNPGLMGGGRGVILAQTLISKGVEAVVTGNIGGNAYLILKQAGVKILNGIGLNAKEALIKAYRGELPEATQWGRWGQRFR